MNKKDKSVVLFGSVVISVLLVAQGCDFREHIEVKAPKDIALVLDYDPPLMLSDAERAYEKWTDWAARTDADFVASIEKAQERYNFIHQWTSVGLSIAGGASEGIPYGGLLFGALTGAVGLMLPQPKMMSKGKGQKPKTEEG
jgi:hypothetical protein